MSTLSRDTRPEAERVQIDLVRKMSTARKLYFVGQMNQAVRDLALGGLRARYPHASPQELKRRLADLLLGSELATRLYGTLDEVMRK